MASSAQRRLNLLFENQSRPAMPDPGHPNLADTELQSKKRREESSAVLGTTQGLQSSCMPKPEQAKYTDLFISSDEDDYVAAFSKKPQMKPPRRTNKTTGNRVTPESATSGHDSHTRGQGEKEIAYIPKGKNFMSQNDDEGEKSDDHEDSTPPIEDVYDNAAIGHFCLLSLVAKFPYKYMKDPNDRVSRHFFADHRFYNRQWDIFYLNPPPSTGSKAILLLSYQQVEQLVNEISAAFKTEVAVPPPPFTMSFFNDGTPQPQFLGTSQSKKSLNELERSIRPASTDYGIPPSDASLELQHCFSAFHRKCDRALNAANQRKSTATKTKNKHYLLATQDWRVQLRRAQRYFGLRPSGRPLEPDPAMSWSEQATFHKENSKKHKTSERLNPDAPAPHPFEKQPVIIAVDIESYERAHNLITEIGVSTLDTLDLLDLPPGSARENWISQIRSRHFRIRGRGHLINKDFCLGNPEAFLFGKSEFVRLEEVPDVVDGCFEWPFSVQFKDMKTQQTTESAPTGRLPQKKSRRAQKPSSLSTTFEDINAHGPTNAEQSAANQAAVAKILAGRRMPADETGQVLVEEGMVLDPSTAQKGPKDRTLLLVGHNIGADLSYLEILGSKIFGPSHSMCPAAATETMNGSGARSKVLSSILEALDTANLYRALKGETQNRSLGSILTDLDRTPLQLHNSGNDARYTLEALVAMVIKARLNDDEARLNDDKERRKDDDAADNIEHDERSTDRHVDADNTADRLLPGKSLAEPIAPRATFATSLPILTKPIRHPVHDESRPGEAGDAWA